LDTKINTLCHFLKEPLLGNRRGFINCVYEYIPSSQKNALFSFYACRDLLRVEQWDQLSIFQVLALPWAMPDLILIFSC
jgi:hypothetical protein